MVISFFVGGRPATAGSKTGFPFRKTDGSLGVRMAPANKNQKSWMSLVKFIAMEHAPPQLLTGPLVLTVRIEMARPKGHFGKHGLKPSAPKFHTVRPDSLKIARAVEDALTGMIWKDDSQVVAHSIWKVYGDRPGVEVKVEEFTAASSTSTRQAASAVPSSGPEEMDENAWSLLELSGS